MGFYDKLHNATINSKVCVGLDPVPERLPDHLKDMTYGVAEFLEEIIKATAPFAAAYKPNLAFFEALGLVGDDALMRATIAVRRYAPDALLIGDAKRSDIGSTAERYAVALLDRMDFDVVTVNPYLGWDGIYPFVERQDKGVFLLALTSNPSGAELQSHGGKEDPLYLKVASFAENVWNKYNNIGLVVGATKGDKIARVRETAPSLPFLLPGIGAQGGDLKTVVNLALGSMMPPGLINSSRGIIYASSAENFAEAAARETEKLRDQIEKLIRIAD